SLIRQIGLDVRVCKYYGRRRVPRRRLVLGGRRPSTSVWCSEDRQSCLWFVLCAWGLFRYQLHLLCNPPWFFALANISGTHHFWNFARLYRSADRTRFAHGL